MDLNQHKGKLLIVATIGALVCVAIISVLATLVITGRVKEPTRQAKIPPAENTPAQALDACDRLASTPGDPMRAAAAVSDDQFVPTAALAACREAVAKNPEVMRAHFELGRSLWIVRRDAEAYDEFKIALRGRYAAADKSMGDAYRDNRLPPGQTPNLVTAIALYARADQGGFSGAALALDDARRQLARMTFDKSLFLNGDYMEMIYKNDFSGLNFPVGLVYYMQGLAEGLEDNNVVFQDQVCRELVSKTALDALQVAEPLAIVGATLGSQDGQGKWTPEGLIKALLSGAAKDYIVDQGKRDATVLYNPDQRYGCDSDVTKQILSHIMIIVKNTSK